MIPPVQIHPAPKLVVTGATGFIGSKLVALAESIDIRVLPIVRSEEKARLLGFENWSLFDELTGHQLRALGFASSVLVHLIGSSRDEPNCTLQQSIVETTQRVVAAAESGDISRIVYLSGYGVRSDSSEVYFRSKAEAEQIVRTSGIPYIILRTSYIFGPGDEITPYLLEQFQNGLVEIPGDGSYRFQPVYVDDVIRVILEAASLRNDESLTVDLLGPAISFSAYVGLLAERFNKNVTIRKEPLETFIRRAVLSRDPAFTTGELAVLVCDLIGPETNDCLGIRIRGVEDTLDSWLDT